MSLGNLLRLVFTVAATPPVVVLYLNIETYAARKGWDGLLTGLIEGGMSPAFEWTLSPWAIIASLGAVSFVAGIWTDVLIRRLQVRHPSRQDRLKELSMRIHPQMREMQAIAGIMRPSGVVSERTAAELQSLYHSLEAVGLKTPKIDVKNAKRYVRYNALYLVHIYPLARDGHYKQAKKEAAQISYQAAHSSKLVDAPPLEPSMYA